MSTHIRPLEAPRPYAALGAALFLCALLPCQSAPPVRLVADINTLGAPASSRPVPGTGPGQFLSIGPYTYFYATGATTGGEVYRTLGSPGTTQLLRDLNPGVGDSLFYFPAVLGTKLIYGATDGVNGVELWSYDATTGRTTLLRDINPGPGGSNPQQMTTVGSYVFFKAQTPNVGDELWRTDGTPGGTVFLKDINPGQNHSRPIFFTGYKNRAYFAAQDGNGFELWTSDGTPAGTTMVKDIAPGVANSTPQNFIEFRGELWFTATHPQTGTEVWKTDGTAQGTVLAFDVDPAGDSNPNSYTLFRGELWFSASSAATGRELWHTDGTRLSAFEIRPGAASGSAGVLLTAGQAPNERLYFVADGLDAITRAPIGVELHVYDGVRVTPLDLNPGPATSAPAYLADAGNGEVFFRAIHPTLGNELWATGGTPATTRVVRDINQAGGPSPSQGSSFPFYITPNPGGGVLFSADDGTANGRELWFSNGTAQGTRMVADINPAQSTQGAAPRQLTDVAGTLFFSADDGLAGRELWRSDGTALGTRRAADLVPGAVGSDPRWLTRLDTRLFFAARGVDANGKDLGVELQVYDLQTGRTSTVDVRAGTAGSDPGDLVAWRGRVWFHAEGDLGQPGNPGRELWVSDGTQAGTRLVRDIAPGSASSAPNFLTPFRGRLYFAAGGPTSGIELWSTDGTAQGTRLEHDVLPGSGDSRPSFLAVAGDRLVFRAFTPTNGMELYATDGRTLTLLDIQPGAGASFPNPARGSTPLADAIPFLVVGGAAFFVADDGQNGEELWRSDGTMAGTRMVIDFTSGPGGSSITSIGRLGDGVAFRALDPVAGFEPFVTDGTAQGTRRIADLYPGPLSSSPAGFTPVGSRHVAFVGRSAAGAEPVFSDGTAAGTFVLDVQPGTGSSLPVEFTLAGGTLFFAADDGRLGFELHAIDPGAVAQQTGAACSSSLRPLVLDGTDPVLGGSTTLTLGLAPASSAGALWLALRAPVPMSLAPDCELHGVMTAAPLLLGLRTDPRGGWSGSFAVPNLGALAGVPLALQAAVGPTPTAPLGLDISNPVVMTAGR